MNRTYQDAKNAITLLKQFNMKSLKTLLSISWYCITHPHERFWQALCNFSNCGQIRAVWMCGDEEWEEDTYYWG